VIKGSEAAFENVWLSRDTHLEKVPGFVKFHLLKGPEAEDHTLYQGRSWRAAKLSDGSPQTLWLEVLRRAAYQPSRKMGCATHSTADKALSLQ
jgi:hypothetical protein